MYTDDIEHLGETIKRLRKNKGWSQQKLAELSGLDRTTIGSLERNTYSDLGIRKVNKLLSILGKRLCIQNKGLPTLDDLNQQKWSRLHE